MKYSLSVHEFSYNKIKNGTRKVGVHLFDKKAQQIKLHDTLELCNISTKEKLNCEVLGIAIFDNFSNLIDALTPQALGYTNKEEIMIRLERMYPPIVQKSCNAVGFFLRKTDEDITFNVRPELER